MRALVLAASAVLAAAGCAGPTHHPVAGRVTFDRAELPDGEIQFVHENPAFGPEAGPIVNGRFELKVRHGKNAVKITAARSIGKKGGFEFSENYIPARYNDSTELTADVPAGGYVNAPLGSTHWFKNTGDNEATMLVLVAPGGLDAMFRETGTPVSDPASPIRPPDAAEKAKLLNVAPRFGVTLHVPGH